MKKVIVLATVAVLATACEFNLFDKIKIGNGIPVEKSFEVSEYDVIHSAGSSDIYYSQTPGSVSASLKADEDLIDYYRVNTDQGILSISTEKGIQVFPKVDVALTTNSSSLKQVSISGSGDCYLTSNLNVDTDFEFNVSGSGNLNAGAPCKICCRDFSAEITGSGDIAVGTLNATDASIRISGSGSAEIESIKADKITITITGSGDIYLNCKDAGDIVVRITGSGDVELKGNARSLEQKITGSGRINMNGLSLSGN